MGIIINLLLLFLGGGKEFLGFTSQIESRPHTTDLPQKVAQEGKWDPFFHVNLGWRNIIPFGQDHESLLLMEGLPLPAGILRFKT